VKAITLLVSVRPTVSGVRWTSAVMSNLGVAAAVFAAAYEGRVQRASDRRDGWRLIYCRFTELLADQQSMAAQWLGTRPSVDRQQVPQDVSRNPIRHQCRQPGLQLVQLRGSTDSAMAN
jgi:hypothetical protein